MEAIEMPRSVQIAAAYAGLREFNTAEQLLEEIEDPYEFCHATAAVAFEHYQAGDQNAAIKLLADGPRSNQG